MRRSRAGVGEPVSFVPAHKPINSCLTCGGELKILGTFVKRPFKKPYQSEMIVIFHALPLSLPASLHIFKGEKAIDLFDILVSVFCKW